MTLQQTTYQSRFFIIYISCTFLPMILSGCYTYPMRSFTPEEKPTLLNIEPPVNADKTNYYGINFFTYKPKCGRRVHAPEIKKLGELVYENEIKKNQKFREKITIPTSEDLYVFLYLQDGFSKVCKIGMLFKPYPDKIYGLKTGFKKKESSDGFCSMELYEITSNNSKAPVGPVEIIKSLGDLRLHGIEKGKIMCQR